MKEGKTQIERPLTISIVSIIVFFLGLSGTVLGIVSLGVSHGHRNFR